MSSETLPISPARFALAIADLPLSTLALKVAELRNSIAHLDYSNEQLKPFAEGKASASTSTVAMVDGTQQQGQVGGQVEGEVGQPDQDCIDAIAENEIVIKRMIERIDLLRKEVESRGVNWSDLSGEVVKEEESVDRIGRADHSGDIEPGVNGHSEGRSEAWNDGTFTTGRIVNGEVSFDGDHSTAVGNRAGTGVNGVVNGTATSNGRGGGGGGGRLDDEALRRAMEERMRNLGQDDDDEGMHL